MSHKVTKAVLELDPTPCPHEEAMLSTCCEADAEMGETIKQARAAGISWPNIFALMMQFGPQFVAMIQAILAALNTPVPGYGKTDNDLPESYVDEHRAKKHKKSEESNA